jgi:hypothetical protein
MFKECKEELKIYNNVTNAEENLPVIELQNIKKFAKGKV